MDQVRLALVGCGWMGHRHAKQYGQLVENGCREFVVTACCDTSEDSAQAMAEEIAGLQDTKPEVVTDIEKLAAGSLADAADVCVPHCFHHSAAVPLLEGGMHVLIEKPIGITIKAGRRIVEAAERNNRILATAENTRRFLGARASRWAIVDAGLIGEPLAGNVVFVRNAPINVEDPKFKWRGVKLLTGGGMIMDSGAHFCDMIQHVFGEVDDVYCTMETHDPRPIKDAPVVGDAVLDVEEAWHAAFRFRNGMRIAWSASYVFHDDGGPMARYYGTEGTIYDSGNMHPFQNGGTIKRRDGAELDADAISEKYLASLSDEEKNHIFPYGLMDGFSVEIADFIRAVRTGSKPEMDGHDGLRSKALCEACYESATAGTIVSYEDVLSGKIHAYQDPIDQYWSLD